MKMDCQDSAECQNWEKNDIIGINGKVYMTLKTKVNSAVSSFEKGKKENVERKEKRYAGGFWISFSRERVSSFSLGF